MKVSDKLFAKIAEAQRTGIKLHRLEVTNNEADHLLAECDPRFFDVMADRIKFYGVPVVIVSQHPGQS